MLTWIAIFVMVLLGCVIIVRALLKQRSQTQKQIDVSTPEIRHQPIELVSKTDQSTDNSSLSEDVVDTVEYDSKNQSQQIYQTIEMFVFPKDEAVIEGLDIIGLMSYYSMLYDAESGIFYRYDNEVGEGEPWFGMIGIYDDEFQRFDLNELSKKRYSGLAFFVSLPHPQPLPAFDTMTQIVSMIANQLSVDVYYKDIVTYELLPITDAWVNVNRASLQD